MTIRQAVDRYFEEKVDGKKSAPETAAVLDRLATFFGDDTLLPDLTSDEIAAYVSWRKVQTAKAGRNKGKAPVAPASVNREVELLRRVLYRARKTWKRQIDDEIDWTELRLAEPEERVRYLTAAEEARLVPVMLRQRMEVLAPFAFAINTGARQSAVLKLKWADIDFEQRLFSIKLKSNKPGGETHYIDLDDTSLGILGSQTDENGEPLHPEFVFTYECRHPRGARKKGQRHPWTPTGLTKIWKGILREARIEDFRWHDLRHTAATRMLQEKGDLAKVKKMLGHKSITSTARYAHVDRRDQREAMVAVGRRNAGLLHQLHTSQGLHQPIPLIDLDKSA
jgi:integrase